MKSKGRIAAFALTVVVAALVTVFACGCSSQPAEEKNIPDGMSEAAYDMGTEIYDLCGSYISGSDGYDTTAAAVTSAMQKYAGDIDTENSEQDMRAFMMCSVINMELTTNEEGEYSKGSIENYRDGLGYTLQTGEYSDDFKMLETE